MIPHFEIPPAYVAPPSPFLQLIVPSVATAPSLFIPSPAVLLVLKDLFVATKVIDEGQREDRVQGDEERCAKVDCEVRGVVGKSRVVEEQAWTAFGRGGIFVFPPHHGSLLEDGPTGRGNSMQRRIDRFHNRVRSAADRHESTCVLSSF